MTPGLTRRQRDLLGFISDHVALHDGVPPSYDEMTVALGLKSKSGVHRIIEALVERGCIEKMPNRARAIRVIDPSERSDDFKRGHDRGYSEGHEAGYNAGWRAALNHHGLVVVSPKGATPAQTRANASSLSARHLSPVDRSPPATDGALFIPARSA